MTVATSAAVLVSILPGGGSWRASSEEAGAIERLTLSIVESMQSSETLGRATQRQAIYVVARDCAQPGWDGADAAPVQRDTVLWAERFLQLLPLSLPRPTVGVEPDGDLTFEWYASRHRLLSVSISPSGMMHYAAMIGSARQSGRLLMGNEMPSELIDLIWRIMA